MTYVRSTAVSAWDSALEAPARAALRKLRLGDRDAGRTLYDSRAYREIHGVSPALRVDISDAGRQAPLLFRDSGDHAVCLARTETLSSAVIRQGAEALFSLSRLRFVVFEDVQLVDHALLPAATRRFHYQSDWVLALEGPDAGIPGSLRKKLDRKLRRLEKEHGDVTLSIEPRPGRAIVESALDLSRRKIEASGRAYHVDEHRREQFVKLCAAVGTAAILRHGEHLISVDIFVENDRDAYALFGGYDEAYAKESPGMITISHAVGHFEKRGFRSVHLLWGDSPYKGHLGAERKPLSTLIVARNRSAWLCGSVLREAMRFGLLDTRRRIKENEWLADRLRVSVEFIRKIRA